MKIAHLTSAHGRYDTRIYLKQCRSLAARGYETYLVVADGKGDETREFVHIRDSGRCRGRFERMHAGTRRVLEKALEIDADLYHLHDPELLPAGLILRARGKKVIFDSHEDVPQQILSKHYLPRYLRKAISLSIGVFEYRALKYLDHVIAATPYIRDKITAAGISCTAINNYPILSEFSAIDPLRERNANRIAYVGGLTTVRGVVEAVDAIALLNGEVQLSIAGPFQEPGLQERLSASSGWAYVEELGNLDREGVSKLLASSKAGLVTLHPTPAYLDALPVKMFEYMSAGLPVIASNFPRWRDIIEGARCGICVNPEDPRGIAEAIQWLLDHPTEAIAMGLRGREAVQQHYNWDAESDKLMTIYRNLLPTS